MVPFNKAGGVFSLLFQEPPNKRKEFFMQPQTHEWMFYEFMWRIQGQGRPLPLPWWVQQYFRRWTDVFDGGLFDTKEGAFASNANYRYWNMIGVKDAPQECLVGQAGEIEPVYDEYALSFFLFDPATRQLDFPQFPAAGVAAPLRQRMDNGYLPIIVTTWQSRFGCEVEEKALATTVGVDQKAAVFARFKLRRTGNAPTTLWFGVVVSPAGPTGFQRHDRAGRYAADRRLTFMQYLPAEQRLLINSSNGPLFDQAPASFGTYGNGNSYDPQFYIDQSPFRQLATTGTLNGWNIATDNIAGICSGAFVWPVNLTPANPNFALDVRLPVDDFRGAGDIATLRAANADTLDNANRAWWTNKLDATGLQATLPPLVAHLWNLFRTCRSNLLILADDGQIHPGPTIYDEFWIRDSSVEAIACALVGDQNLAQRQLGYWHPSLFNFGYEQSDGVSLHGFFGGTHEKNDREWDSNGEALWAFGRFDRILGSAVNFGRGLFTPYIIEGARWIRDNRTQFGLLPSGWSAEHIGDKGEPHFWDDFWSLAGLWEAARLAQRIGAAEADEIWRAYDSLRDATANSIRWVLDQQRQRGFWETFIPTGPGDVGRLDSTMIGVLAYFHPCRLYDGAKLGADIDSAARMTLETIWGRFMDGGFRHDSAWNCYGPYLTLQLAHSFLLLGDVTRMDQCLQWLVGNAGYSTVSRENSPTPWQVVLGAWNEQHCYPISKDFREMPDRFWYMGDIPHGWACAEFMTLVRDILFFEADEDGDAKIFLAPGVMPHWLGEGESTGATSAPTVFGQNFGYRLTHRQSARRVEINITQPSPANVRLIYPCRFGSGVQSAIADGNPVPVSGRDVQLPPGTATATIQYNA
jgi:hypothetical protein